MKKTNRIVVIAIFAVIAMNLACDWSLPEITPTSSSIEISSSPTASYTIEPEPSPSPLVKVTAELEKENLNEPVSISGSISYSSPFFLNSAAEPFVMLEDQAGFVNRNTRFEFRLESQIIGPVEFVGEGNLKYHLALPSEPQGTFVDLDDNFIRDKGVQVFAVAYWSNTWGDPFLEKRDGTGWSTAYASTITDPENEYEITGGTLVVWAPDDNQIFPSGFGDDGLLFTKDDPTRSIPAGYNFIDLNTEHFRFYKKDRMTINLVEGDSALKDYSGQKYGAAFESLIDKISHEYPFTQEKGIDWQQLKNEFLPRAIKARSDQDYYNIIQEFILRFPDAHVSISFNRDAFYENYGNGFGLLLTELSNGRVIASDVFPGLAADKAGILTGAEILTWDGIPVSEAIEAVIPLYAPYSTQHSLRINQTGFLTRVSPSTVVNVNFKNLGQSEAKQVVLKSTYELDSILKLLSLDDQDALALPVEGEILEGPGLGYIKITTFNTDHQLMARLWDYYIDILKDQGIPGLIIDLRKNGGGSLGLALDFSGYFFDEEFHLYRKAYFSDKTGKFEYSKDSIIVQPGPDQYSGEIAVLIGPDCVSACEGFAYALSQGGRSTLFGHYPTAGAFGEVGRGQYRLPGDISLQFPTGRQETLDGKLLIEGSGVSPDILVPVTLESAIGEVDAVLQAAIDTLLKMMD